MVQDRHPVKHGGRREELRPRYRPGREPQAPCATPSCNGRPLANTQTLPRHLVAGRRGDNRIWRCVMSERPVASLLVAAFAVTIILSVRCAVAGSALPDPA